MKLAKKKLAKNLPLFFLMPSSAITLKVNPELGKTAFDVNNLKANIPNNEAVDFCKQVLGENEKPTDPVESVKEIGNMLADLRKTKANEVQ